MKITEYARGQQDATREIEVTYANKDVNIRVAQQAILAGDTTFNLKQRAYGNCGMMVLVPQGWPLGNIEHPRSTILSIASIAEVPDLFRCAVSISTPKGQV